jgi:hypothetical protein
MVIGVYSFVYIMGVVLVISWIILGVILFPERYLALASGAIVFVTYSLTTFQKIKDFNDDLGVRVEKVIQKELYKILVDVVNITK